MMLSLMNTYYKFTAECASEKNLKIGQYFMQSVTLGDLTCLITHVVFEFILPKYLFQQHRVLSVYTL